MTIRVALVALALMVGYARAERLPPPDELSKAYDAALTELRAGEDRQGIAGRLEPVVERLPDSSYARLARPLLLDLTASAKNPPARPADPPEKRLAETRIPFYLLSYAENWGEPLKAFVAKEANDPCSELVAADRAVITRLTPLLADRSPARCDGGLSSEWTTPQPRVCDLALALIEYHGKVRFHHDTIQGTYLHQLSDAEREEVAARVAAWWEEVKDKRNYALDKAGPKP
jgi:hypothetical protein